MARHRTPDSIKHVTGRSALGDRPMLTRRAVTLPCPLWLTPAARAWHEHYSEVLTASRTATEGDAGALAELAQTAAEVDRLRAEIAKLPSSTYETTSATGGVMHRPFPNFAMLETAARRLAKLLSEFGLTAKVP